MTLKTRRGASDEQSLGEAMSTFHLDIIVD